MSVCSIDFSRATWETKNKLIRLNNFRKENGYINKFVDSDDVSIIKKDKYVGGYPLCGFVPTWQFHRISGHDLRFSNDVHYHHSIGPNSNKLHNQYSNYIDTSFQYVFNKPTSQDWLGGGASGSMLITQDYEVCGILWGCKRLKNGPCWPCFSLFKTSQYDFISK
ncbi:MAG: DUF31 family protein [Mycoplasmoidaceae bacterium]|nr:DUF31 family protein [Mycoplasmoidaceae bacterium]